MAFTSPEALQAEVKLREARIVERTDALCLKQLLSMGRQSYILLPSVFFIAYLAVAQGAVLWAAVWFVAWTARMVYVFRLVGRLRREPDAPPGPALSAVVKGYLFAGIVAGGLLPMFFSRADDMVLLIVTFLVTIYGSTMMIAASGVLCAGLAYGIPTLGVLIVGWFWRGGALGIGLGCFLALSFSLSIVAIRSQRKALMEVVRVIDDNERLSAALAHERDRAESASESKTRFFAAASHDLRQPLHALSINATTLDLVARRSGDALLEELSRGIGSALRQSRGLLDGLLDISRLDANAVKAQLVPLDVGDLLEAVREEFHALACQRGLTLEVRRDSNPAPWALTDADQFLRIMGNLVDNAIKFTSTGGVVMSALSARDGRTLVRVSDTGPGIPEAERERVFEEFYQVGNPSRDRTHGLGLGLAIVERTAVLLRANLHLCSTLGGGTTVELSMPAAFPVRDDTPSLPAAPQTLAPLSVLLVDDEPDVLASLGTYLRQINWSVQGAASGDEAERLLNEGFHVDIAVVDFRLRRESGVDVITRLRQHRADLLAVIVTGDTAAHQLREFAGLRVGVLHKPIDGERLAFALRAAVDTQSTCSLNR